MDRYTPSRKPFVIKYGGMAYRGEGRTLPMSNVVASIQGFGAQGFGGGCAPLHLRHLNQRRVERRSAADAGQPLAGQRVDGCSIGIQLAQSSRARVQSDSHAQYDRFASMILESA